jgi:hypothetical protein
VQDIANPPRQVFDESVGHDSGQAPLPRDLATAVAARERLDKIDGQIAGIKEHSGQTQDAIADTNVKLDVAREEKRQENAIADYEAKVTDLGSRVQNANDIVDIPNQLDAATQGAAFGHALDSMSTGLPSGDLRNVVEYAKVAYDYQSTKDDITIVGDELFHQQQMAEVNALKEGIDQRIANAEKAMSSTMGTAIEDMGTNAQREFYHNEYSQAFHDAEQLRAGQEQQRDAFFASNNAVLPHKLVEQQQNRAAMNEEFHARHYGLTRELANENAEINVNLSNKEMLQKNQARLERQEVPSDEIQKQAGKLTDLQHDQHQNDVYQEANKIHAQQSPQMAMNPPSIAYSGPGDGGAGGGAPQQQGPALQM